LKLIFDIVSQDPCPGLYSSRHDWFFYSSPFSASKNCLHIICSCSLAPGGQAKWYPGTAFAAVNGFCSEAADSNRQAIGFLHADGTKIR
jgi:hypothetical protein